MADPRRTDETHVQSKASRREAGNEWNAAQRLLAQQGFDSERLTQDLHMVEATTAFEDIFQDQSLNVEEYVQQVHDASVVAAIQQAQNDTLENFDEFLMRALETDWASDKKQLLHYFGRSLTPGPQTTPRSPYSAARTPYTIAKTPTTIATPARADATTPSRGVAKPSQYLPPRFVQYAKAVKNLNTAVLRGSKINAADAFKEAVDTDTTNAMGGTGSVNLSGCWSLLSGLLTGKELQDEDAIFDLLKGAKSYLEKGHARHILEVIRQNPAIASLGGNTSNRAKVQAFLRVKYRDRGALDFDKMGGVDTTWQQIYFCLRSGFYEEALSICKGCNDVSLSQIGGEGLAKFLKDWMVGQTERRGSAYSILDAECERLLKEKSLWNESTQHKIMLFSIITGNRHVADRLHADYLFRTFEDFMWFKLSLIRDFGSEAVSIEEPKSPFVVGDGRSTYTLLDFQSYLKQFDPTHYTKNGREPLLYVTVLLLSLQFGEVVTFLSRDPSAEAYRCDAVHFAIAFMHHGLLSLGGKNANAQQAEQEASMIVHSYAKTLSSEDPRIALQYYAMVDGAKATISGRLLRELLVESRAFDLILGAIRADGTGGELAHFIPDRAARQQLLVKAGLECEFAAQFEEAREFYMHAGYPGSALCIINRKLSEACAKYPLPSALHGDPYADIVRLGQMAVQTIRSGMGVEGEKDRKEMDAFEQLVRVKDFLIYAKQEKYPDALRMLAMLSFIPLEAHRIDKCASDVHKLHSAVSARLPEILLSAAECLSRAASMSTGEAAKGLLEQVHCIESFAGSSKVRVPAHVCAQLSRISASMG